MAWKLTDVKTEVRAEDATTVQIDLKIESARQKPKKYRYLVSPKHKRVLALGPAGYWLDQTCRDTYPLYAVCDAPFFESPSCQGMREDEVPSVSLLAIEEATLAHAELAETMVDDDEDPDLIMLGKCYPWKGVYNWLEAFDCTGVFLASYEKHHNALWSIPITEGGLGQLREGWVVDEVSDCDHPLGYITGATSCDSR